MAISSASAHASEPASASAPARGTIGQASLAVVAIGRNEGERLRRCLGSVQGDGVVRVYVDSGSSDGSVEVARSLGADVVALDLARPFTAARARNEGFQRLKATAPQVTWVQFVDGDCELDAHWLATATAFLSQHDDVAIVCGRRRERHPERSVYNRLCDEEWNTAVGEAKACGGDALVRASAFEQVGGFRESLIAGEEPELCLRLRDQRWRIWRLDAEMTLHDAAMTRFAQWWRRSERAGFAFAEGASLHGGAPHRHWVREARSARAWAMALPVLVLLCVLAFGAVGWLGLLLYPLQVLRLALRGTGEASFRWARAFFLVAGKFPEAFGQARFFAQRVAGRRAALIEYK